MNSLIFAAFSRILFGVMLVVSVYVLYRGHNEPGGGFVGGFVAGLALSSAERRTETPLAQLAAAALVVLTVMAFALALWTAFVG